MRRYANYKWVLLSVLIGAIPAPAASARASGGGARTTIALLPRSTTARDLAAVDGMALGLMSAGLGRVSAEQTYLDMSRGNRIWRSIDDRPPPRCAISSPLECVRRIAPGLTLRRATPSDLTRLVAALRGRDLLIAFSRPPPAARRQLVLGVAGEGFEGVLTSDSTRMRGLVLSTDIAPTILDRLGIPVPEQMDGRPVRAEGERDAAALERLQRRLGQVGPRRGPVIGGSVRIWLALALLAVAFFRLRGLRAAAPLLALSCVYLPALLLAGAALEPPRQIERLIVAAGAPALAALSLRLLPAYAALAAACGLTTAAYAADLMAGSPLTALSLMGPNPALGARFYGIGNELEAALAVLVLAGTGSALAAARAGGRRAAVWFLAAGGLAAAIFAAGRLGADVGAAIMLPVGAAVAALVVLGPQRPRRALLAVAAAPILALACLATIDLLLGGDAHLSRSVLDAGGLDSLADIAERRLRLSARSFVRAESLGFLIATAATIALAAAQRRRLIAWLEGRPAALAGFAGAAAATVTGTLVNDSGALLLMIGTAYLALYAAFAWWAEAGKTEPDS